MDAPVLAPADLLSNALKGALPDLSPSSSATSSSAPSSSTTPATPSPSDAVANAVAGSLGPFGALLSIFHPTDTAQAAKGLLLLVVLIIMGLALTIAGAYIAVTE